MNLSQHKFLLWKIAGLVFVGFIVLVGVSLRRINRQSFLGNNGSPGENHILFAGMWTTDQPGTASSPIVTLIFAEDKTGYRYALENGSYMASRFRYQILNYQKQEFTDATTGKTMVDDKVPTEIEITDSSGSQNIPIKIHDVQTLVIRENGHDVSFKRVMGDQGYLNTWY